MFFAQELYQPNHPQEVRSMDIIVTPSKPNLNTGPGPPSHRVVIHYIFNGHVICEATHLLIADVNFLQIPLPVIHEMKRRAMR